MLDLFAALAKAPFLLSVLGVGFLAAAAFMLAVPAGLTVLGTACLLAETQRELRERRETHRR